MRFVKTFAISVSVSAVCLAGSANAQNWDAKLLMSINPENPNSTYWKESSNSMYGASVAVPIGSLAYGFLAKDKTAIQNGIEATGSVVIATVLAESIKRMVGRDRPGITWGSEISTSPTTTKSFPSGHTALAFATATTLALEYKKWYVTVPAYAYAGSVAYSRMYLGKHYPTDVLAGMVVGTGAGLLSHWLTHKVFSQTLRKDTPKGVIY